MCIDVVFPYYNMIFLLLSMEHYMTSSFLQFQNLFKSTSPKLLSLQEYNSMIEENLNIIEELTEYCNTNFINVKKNS